jgi:hypothetical protein
MPEDTIKVAEVQVAETRTGTKRFVVKADDGREFTTFRERIGADAEAARGRRARVKFHEQQKGQYTNVYLDEIEALPEEAGAGGEVPDADEVAWSTAVEAAPWLVGTSDPKEAVDPEELYERLEPFKRRVAEDIREGDDEDEG